MKCTAISERLPRRPHSGVFTERSWGISAASLDLDKDGTLHIFETWLQMPIGEENEWIVACRLEAQEGTPVIAELRVFPNEPGDFLPGKWSVDDPHVYLTEPRWSSERTKPRKRLQALYETLKTAQGIVRVGQIPRGGITTRLLRKVQLSYAQQVHKVARVRFLKLEAESVAPPVTPTVRGQRRGRKGRPDSFYAEIAKVYAETVNAGSVRPVADIATRRRLPQSQVRDMVARARRLGFLSANVTAGKFGGKLTERAESLLGLGQEGGPRARARCKSPVAHYPVATSKRRKGRPPLNPDAKPRIVSRVQNHVRIEEKKANKEKKGKTWQEDRSLSEKPKRA